MPETITRIRQHIHIDSRIDQLIRDDCMDERRPYSLQVEHILAAHYAERLETKDAA